MGNSHSGGEKRSKNLRDLKLKLKLSEEEFQFSKSKYERITSSGLASRAALEQEFELAQCDMVKHVAQLMFTLVNESTVTLEEYLVAVASWKGMTLETAEEKLGILWKSVSNERDTEKILQLVLSMSNAMGGSDVCLSPDDSSAVSAALLRSSEEGSAAVLPGLAACLQAFGLWCALGRPQKPEARREVSAQLEGGSSGGRG
eukprot:CAMPEP_0177590032 /NCGR_PEP_ID=MMETSP0419_2-20121207/7157_1 /TAXON_ID=582737 /ORGANISM="Tetraselmis sp., Strain GSL018" /LENGTH=201 /DNA_ID=CAMNT_0019080499 /DNA_START=242 /DNA_END=843 /DNA_ORIENTATION=-